MAVAVHIYSCLLAMTTLAAEPDRPIIDARAVLWPYRDSFSGDWMCDVLIKNLGDEIIEIPRFPTAYNERLVNGDGVARSGWMHYDSGVSAIVELEPGRTFVYEFGLQFIPKARAASGSIELMFWIKVLTGELQRDYQISCRIDPRATQHGVSVSDATNKGGKARAKPMKSGVRPTLDSSRERGTGALIDK